MRSIIVRFVPLALIALSIALGQESTGTISGTVTDPSGATIPGAQITITRVDTGVARKETSNAAGLFVLTNLAVGDYRLAAEASGFKRFEANQIRLDVNDRLTIPVHL